jgi:hypothetical protein
LAGKEYLFDEIVNLSPKHFQTLRREGETAQHLPPFTTVGLSITYYAIIFLLRSGISK